MARTVSGVVAMAMSNPTAEEVREWVEKSTRAQGVPFKVTDPSVIEAVAVLLSAGREPVEVTDAKPE